MATARLGTFIVIEGTDGSGKGTQFKLLKERLERAGHAVETFDFPQYDQPSSYFVQRYLNGAYGNADQVGPYTGSLFYALDRFEAAPKIRTALDEGKVVIANRFTGSNMAHQGTKFGNAEERRGYFIWLDNLEFEMLHVPRPDMSFVLRVPAEVAQGLVDQKGKRSYTDKKRDIHEADLSHLQRSVNVYDDLCQLFPKDFTRIDCVRDGQLLPIETVQELLWQKVSPLLPAEPRTKRSSAAAASTTAAVLPEPVSAKEAEAPKTAPPKPESNTILLEDVSQLLLANLAARHGVTRVKVVPYNQKDEQGNYHYFTPDYLPPETKAQYRAQLNAIFDSYAEMHAALTTYLQEAYPAEQPIDIRAQAQAILKAVLPLAATTSVEVMLSNADSDLAAELLGDYLAELRHAGQLLAAKGGASNPAALVTYRADRRKAVAEAAKKLITETYAGAEGPVRLTGVYPRNELDLVADILYPHSSSSLQELRAATDSWKYDSKLAILEAYLGDRQNQQQLPDNTLINVRYNWDLLSDFDSFTTLQQGGLLRGSRWQAPTPRHGFEVPKLIEEANLSDQYQSCFDHSLALYSLLQQAGFPLEAQYATLMGHKLRWRASYDATTAFRLHEHYAAPTAHAGARQLVGLLHQRLAQIHPVLAEAMTFAQPSL